MPVKSRPECVPCIIEQVINTVRRVTQDDWIVGKVVKEVMQELSRSDLELSPAELSFQVLGYALKAVGAQDPYAEEKKRYDRRIMALLPKLRAMTKESKDPLLSAVRLAIAGNIIDLGINSRFDLEEEIEQALNAPLALDASGELKPALKTASKIVYILDNAGEIVFDRLLMELLKDKTLTAVVRKSPILNDATAEDAREVGIDQFARIIDPSQEMLGVVLALASEGFRREFYGADVVLSKGQANFETLCGCDRPVFFMFRAKCPVVAGALNVREGDTVLYYQQPED
jgi:uncharacterized protein with ATP-grasp and redox domains